MKNLLFVLCLFMAGKSSGQDVIALKNPSFEDRPRCCEAPGDWESIGPAQESPPDIQPGIFGCQQEPQQGETFIGLVVRDNDTWERVGQNLNGILQKDSSYAFSVYLAQSSDYWSYSRAESGRQLINYNRPAVLRIWGYNRQAKREELLAESKAIFHNAWIRYDFVLIPENLDCDALDLEAYFTDNGQLDPYNGNLLIDNCSPITKIKN